LNDGVRKGSTVKPFDNEQSWYLLCQLLADEGSSPIEQRHMLPSEKAAAKSFLSYLGGLPLAIQQLASLIKSAIGGPTIASTLEAFEQNARNLPEQQAGNRTSIIHNLDTIFDMTFRSLDTNTRKLLSVLALLPPGSKTLGQPCCHN
jgi:hypothetical protein